jgi:hypothetical protein
MPWKLVAAMLILLGVFACYSPRPPTGSPCQDDSQCPSSLHCFLGTCTEQNASRDGQGPDTSRDGHVVFDASQDASMPDVPMVECTDTCPNTNPCETVACVNQHCVATKKPDGTTCGSSAGARCCAGACADISADENNCGGCGLKCAAGFTCESVSITTSCSSAPAKTSGRCRCNDSNAECPHNQVCRTFIPYNNRCAPAATSNCASGEVADILTACPNYCHY